MYIEFSEDLSINVERKRDTETYYAEIAFYDTDGNAYSVDYRINLLLDDREVTGRADISEAIVREAAHALYERLIEEGQEIDEIIYFDIVVKQKLRKTPWGERNYRDE